MRVPSTKVQNNFGKYLKYVEVNEEIIVTKKGKDVARILPCDEEYARLVEEGTAEYQSREGWVTYKEFLELTENSDQRFELIDGVVYNLAAPVYDHQHALIEISSTFHIWFKGKKCEPLPAPFDVTLTKSADNICVVQPDIIVVCDKDKIDKNGQYKGVPTLAAEILSPSTRSKDMLKKLDLYKQCGVKEYWLVDPKNKCVYTYILENNEIKENMSYQKGAHEYVESAYFSGLKVALADIF
jgi:prevent-host-death family protein